jgi:hypothetical protein
MHKIQLTLLYRYHTTWPDLLQLLKYYFEFTFSIFGTYLKLNFIVVNSIIASQTKYQSDSFNQLH